MQRLKKNKTKTVAEKVTDLILRQNGIGSSESEEDTPRVADFDEAEYELPLDGRSTDFRKRNVKLLSEQSARYKGKIASRQDFENNESDDDVDEDEDDESDGDDLAAFSQSLKSANYENSDSENTADDNNENDDSEDDGYSEDDGNSEDDNETDNEAEDDISNNGADMITETNRQAEIQKGVSVQNQLRIWERLLELRIHSQKLISKANQLPDPQALQQQRQEHSELQVVAKEATEKTSVLLTTLLELQHALTGQFSEMRNSLKHATKRPAAFSDNAEPPYKRIATQINTRFHAFQEYRNGVLLKWDDRTKLLTPGAGAKKKSLNEEFDILRKIDNTLLNRSALLEKSQILKSAQQTTSVDRTALTQSADEQPPNANIYDDSDFYHQQLRELIEYKANTTSNLSEVTKQYVELQQLRQKMKKKVDTRASKGRKLRYLVHNKLVNFMAPNDSYASANDWTEESVNELCKSLFA